MVLRGNTNAREIKSPRTKHNFIKGIHKVYNKKQVCCICTESDTQKVKRNTKKNTVGSKKEIDALLCSLELSDFSKIYVAVILTILQLIKFNKKQKLNQMTKSH